MPIPNVVQPQYIPVSENIRLRKFDDRFDFALEWYQDIEMVWMVDGDREPYTPARLADMYHYLNAQGELYFIEAKDGEQYRPIGDVTFWQQDMPIVIGMKEYRGRGIGKQVIAALIKRAKSLGYETIQVEDIYQWNTASRKCFESMGFRECGKTKKGNTYELVIG